jgi:phosphopentomutase
MYGKGIRKNVNLGTMDSFAVIGQTVASIFKVAPLSIGRDVLGLINA